MARLNQDYALRMATLDKEWVELIHIARALGISKETVKDFLKLIPSHQMNAEEKNSLDDSRSEIGN